MIADAEAVSVMVEILRELPIGQFVVKLSHRCALLNPPPPPIPPSSSTVNFREPKLQTPARRLDGDMRRAPGQVPRDLQVMHLIVQLKTRFNRLDSAIDKLDKEPWDVVRKEMVDKKGLLGDVADKLQVRP
jgi:hypothetical protein